jgi:hypothetical protein
MSRNEPNTVLSLTKRAYDRLAENGLRNLTRETVRYLTDEVVSRRLVSAVDVQRRRPGRDRVYFTESEDPIVIPPPDDASLRKEFENYPKEFRPDQGFVCALSDCRLVGTNAVALSHRNEILAETTGHRPHREFVGSRLDLGRHVLDSYVGREGGGRMGTVFPLISPDPSFYHWVMEYLPKLRYLELYSEQTGEEPLILLESDPPGFVYDTLETAGYDTDHCTEWNLDEASVSTLVLSTHRPHVFDYRRPDRSEYNPSRADLRWLRDRMRTRSLTSESDHPKPERIYVSRQKARRGRKILNFDEALDILERYGFESYVLEDYSFEEQVNLCSEAEVIMGPHGAGLLQCIFADDSVVAELFPDSVIKPHFYYLAEIFGHEYRSQVTRSDGNNLVIDPESFDRFVRSVVAETPAGCSHA